MPDIVHASGFVDFVNLNKDSTHPNPWKPPSHMDQLLHNHSAAYNVYRGEQHRKFTTIESVNFLNDGSFFERFSRMAWRGFVIGKSKLN
jgi:hypothetical protein